MERGKVKQKVKQKSENREKQRRDCELSSIRVYQSPKHAPLGLVSHIFTLGLSTKLDDRASDSLAGQQEKTSDFRSFGRRDMARTSNTGKTTAQVQLCK